MILGLDVGTRRVGVAIMHEQSLLPVSLATIDSTIAQPLEAIVTIVNANDVSHIVVGFPRRQDGSTSPQTQHVIEFTEVLKKKLPRISFHFQDESVTSVNAEAELASKKTAYSKESIDALAAVYILEDYARMCKGRV